MTSLRGRICAGIGGLHRNLLDPARRLAGRRRFSSRRSAAVGHALRIVFLDSGQLRLRQVLHTTDELWTAAKARADLGVAGTGLPPGEDPPFQRPEHLRVGQRSRPTMGPRTKGQDLGHTPSTAPESPGHLGRVDTSRYEAANPPFNRPQVCLAGYGLRSHHHSTISRATPTQFASSKRQGERGRDEPDSAREGQGVRSEWGQGRRAARVRYRAVPAQMPRPCTPEIGRHNRPRVDHLR